MLKMNRDRKRKMITERPRVSSREWEREGERVREGEREVGEKVRQGENLMHCIRSHFTCHISLSRPN